MPVVSESLGSRQFEAAGLLEGLEGEERARRIELLERLSARGVELEELRQAAADGRLALLSVERELAGEPAFTQREISELSGLSVEQLDGLRRALGLIVSDPDERTLSVEDLEAARRLRVFVDAGIHPESMTETARVMAMSMSQLAAANRELIRPVLAAGTEGELEIARGSEELAAALTPLIGPTLEYIYKQQLREQLRHVVLDVELNLGDEAVDEMAVAFADLVGYTRLGEQLPPEALGRLTGRLGELATSIARGPVRLVKLIGDAAMFAAADVGVLVSSALELSAVAAAEGEDFPQLRIGVAAGPVLARGGDLYGGTVNMASRVTAIARPGSVLVTAPVRDRLRERFRFSNAGSRRLKGIGAPVHVYRCRPAEERDAGGEAVSPAGGEAGSDGPGRRR
jgi:adenylate cyclase